MQVGKLPVEVLSRLLSKVQIEDDRVVLGPRPGEDAALIDFGDRLLVAKTDPITFATDLIGWCAVQVNANDIAAMGAKPRWFMATLLLPEGSSANEVETIFDQLLEACRDLEITLVGGHTEVTYQLSRPIIVGAMLGEVERGHEVLTSGAQVGDAIVLTKGIAIEGTALLARDSEDTLRDAGIDSEIIAKAKGLLFDPGISVVKEALAACEAASIHCMHDPTEGGLATGLLEVAVGGKVGPLLDEERIPVLPECRVICQTLELDPLGLLGSGSLILALDPNEVPKLTSDLNGLGISASEVGRITSQEEGTKLRTKDGITELPLFPRDELARFLSS